MLTKLLENWLDSASERSYQNPFCQILSAQGHTIVHSTRHNPLEYGKDVVTINPDGVPCVFQLKGNPGSRLTLNQFRHIQSQLFQLVAQPITYPGINKKQSFNTYLVTNGLVEEEVQIALDQFNQGFRDGKTYGNPIKIISRGNLINWINDFGVSLWPSELEDYSRLLQICVHDGKSQFPLSLLHDLLSSVLLLTINGHGHLNTNELKRRITSAALLTAVSLRNFALEKNYYAEICAWVLFSTYAIAACDKNGKSEKNIEKAIVIAHESMFHSLSSLCDELMSRNNFIEGNSVVDSFFYAGRFTLITSLMSLYWFWLTESGINNDDQLTFLNKFLHNNCDQLFLWGEGAIPQLLIHIWYLRKTDPTINPDLLLILLLNNIVEESIKKNGIGIVSPYFSFDTVIRYRLRNFLSMKEEPFKGDTFRFRSFFSLSLIHLLVRQNMKQSCKKIWPDFTKINFKYFEPSEEWMFCLKESPKGNEITTQIQNTKKWQELVFEARDVSCAGVPQPLKNNKYLFMLFLIVFPYRSTPQAIRYISKQFCDQWFIDPPIE